MTVDKEMKTRNGRGGREGTESWLVQVGRAEVRAGETARHAEKS